MTFDSLFFLYSHVFSLIGLTQVVQHFLVCIADLTAGELSDCITGATGHSQGIVSAIAAAASPSFKSFAENAMKVLRWLFFCSFHGKDAFPLVLLEQGLIQDSIKGGEGREDDWAEKYSPRLIKAKDGTMYLNTPFISTTANFTV
ncbi:hypothetical protein GYMLUDRAFT_241111 [Collybiopsis luxurians FD-317 M1]|nr:hypothetical protein GYMLUDRAFT_241111 [Collybiopsis luxurians FD-317 M1]